MSYTDQQAAELVSESVQRADGIANLGVGVRAAIADVIRNRIYDEEPDTADVVRERSQFANVVGKTNALGDAVTASDVGARATRRGLRSISVESSLEMKTTFSPEREMREPSTAR